MSRATGPGSLQKQRHTEPWLKLCVERMRGNWKVAVYVGLAFVTKGTWLHDFPVFSDLISTPPSLPFLPSAVVKRFGFPVEFCHTAMCVLLHTTSDGPSCLWSWTPPHLSNIFYHLLWDLWPASLLADLSVCLWSPHILDFIQERPLAGTLFFPPNTVFP